MGISTESRGAVTREETGDLELEARFPTFGSAYATLIRLHNERLITKSVGTYSKKWWDQECSVMEPSIRGLASGELLRPVKESTRRRRARV